MQSGSWVNLQGATGYAAAGTIGFGRTGGTPWKMDVTLGADGECFTAHLGTPGDVGSASICAPVSPVPHGAALTSVPFARPAGAVVWFMGTVSARTAAVRADLSTGQATRIVPTVVGGRKYIALGVREGVRLTRLTLYGPGGQVLASVTDLPRSK